MRLEKVHVVLCYIECLCHIIVEVCKVFKHSVYIGTFLSKLCRLTDTLTDLLTDRHTNRLTD